LLAAHDEVAVAGVSTWLSELAGQAQLTDDGETWCREVMEPWAAFERVVRVCLIEA
jgi:hypothetical protein